MKKINKIFIVLLSTFTLFSCTNTNIDKSKLNSFTSIVRYSHRINDKDNYDICIPEKTSINFSSFGLDDVLVGDQLTIYYEGEIQILETYPEQYSYANIEVKYIDQTKANFQQISLDSLSSYQDQTSGIIKYSDGSFKDVSSYISEGNETIYATTDEANKIIFALFSYQAR